MGGSVSAEQPNDTPLPCQFGPEWTRIVNRHSAREYYRNKTENTVRIAEITQMPLAKDGTTARALRFMMFTESLSPAERGLFAGFKQVSAVPIRTNNSCLYASYLDMEDRGPQLHIRGEGGSAMISVIIQLLQIVALLERYRRIHINIRPHNVLRSAGGATPVITLVGYGHILCDEDKDFKLYERNREMRAGVAALMCPIVGGTSMLKPVPDTADTVAEPAVEDDVASWLTKVDVDQKCNFMTCLRHVVALHQGRATGSRVFSTDEIINVMTSKTLEPVIALLQVRLSTSAVPPAVEPQVEAVSAAAAADNTEKKETNK